MAKQFLDVLIVRKTRATGQLSYLVYGYQVDNAKEAMAEAKIDCERKTDDSFYYDYIPKVVGKAGQFDSMITQVD